VGVIGRMTSLGGRHTLRLHVGDGIIRGRCRKRGIDNKREEGGEMSLKQWDADRQEKKIKKLGWGRGRGSCPIPAPKRGIRRGKKIKGRLEW